MNKPMNNMVSYARITLGVGTKKINTTNSIDHLDNSASKPSFSIET